MTYSQPSWKETYLDFLYRLQETMESDDQVRLRELAEDFADYSLMEFTTRASIQQSVKLDAFDKEIGFRLFDEGKSKVWFVVDATPWEH